MGRGRRSRSAELLSLSEAHDKSHFDTLCEGWGGGVAPRLSLSLFFNPPFLPLRFITSVSPNLG